jgi:hypothetical protein
MINWFARLRNSAIIAQRRRQSLPLSLKYIQRRKQQRILSLFGTIDYDENYDYKRERRPKNQ